MTKTIFPGAAETRTAITKFFYTQPRPASPARA